LKMPSSGGHMVHGLTQQFMLCSFARVQDFDLEFKCE
jgi:hypothetical protein